MENTEEEEILEFLKSEQDAFYHGDFEAFKEHWHHGPEVVRMVSGPHVGTRIHRGWDALLPRFKEGFEHYPQNFNNREIIRNENVQVRISGDMAWISYDQVAAEKPDGMHLPKLSHGLKIVQRIGGTWKLVCLAEIAPGIGREDTPCIELDENGTVVFVNDLARERLSNHPGLIISGDKLRTRQKAYAAGLKGAIQRRQDDLATNLPPGYLNAVASVVLLGEDDAGRAAFCWIVAEQDRILVTFDDALMLRRQLKKAADVFGLSPSQLALSERLASGHELASAAADLGISINTVRTQLRRMFEKTNTHSQTELVALLLSLQNPNKSGL